jgi:hypothetical protein
MLNKQIRIIIFLLMVGILSSCAGNIGNNSTYYLVDPRFSDLYQHLQGEEILGPPISNKKYVAGSNLEKQYFEGAVLVYDPDNSPRYYLDPVGIDAGFSDLPNNNPENPAVRYLNGYVIPLEFSRFYDRMGGERWVGQPLTRARLNPEKNTIEQYFENMGFFRFVDDPPGIVHLMPYGLWKCAGECSMYPGIENAGISRSEPEIIQSPFGEAISRFGTLFTGNAISNAFRAGDGKVEQIFQNVVLFEDSNNPLGVSLRPISSLLELDRDPYQAYKQGAEDYFREIESGTGFYIPTYFMDFIDRYFGFGISGEPISSMKEIRDGVNQQCFENYCLLYDALADPGQQVRILPLGQKYKDSFYQTIKKTAIETQSKRNIQLDIWEQSPQISSMESQQVGACIHDSETPLVGIMAVLTITAADQGIITYPFAPTDSGGCSFLELDPIQAQNGTTIDYQVCFQGNDGQDYCKKDSYLIWGNTDQILTAVPTQEEGGVDPVGEGDFILDTWELYPQISSAENQEIGACVHKEDVPQGKMGAELIIETPDSGVISYQSAPTDGGGCSFFKVDPVDAKNGETIAYQVCFTDLDGEKHCKRDSFLIWGNP